MQYDPRTDNTDEYDDTLESQEGAGLTRSVQPSLVDDPLLNDPVAASGPSSDGPDDPAADGDDVYTPPTDPVVTTDHRGNTRVLGGFQTTSMDENTPVRSSDGTLGDEAIEDAVRAELSEDAATTDLNVDVRVRNGVVTLRGEVELLDDADNAEAVASRVEGVREVRENLDVRGV